MKVKGRRSNTDWRLFSVEGETGMAYCGWYHLHSRVQKVENMSPKEAIFG